MPRSVRMPVVVTVHDLAWHRVQSHAPPYARYYFGAFALRRYRTAANVVVDSEFSRGELLQLAHGLDPARVHVVYPGVAPEFSSLRREGGDGRTILCVGTVERRKNLEVLIRALCNLRAARLVAVGPLTAYASDCRALADRLGVTDRVEMPGYVSRADLLTLYRSAAVAAVPSRYEGFGYAAAQALCAGVPCVVSRCASLPEVVGTDAPALDPDDPAAWAAALDATLHAQAGERVMSARARARARFSWESAGAAMERIYAASVNR